MLLDFLLRGQTFPKLGVLACLVAGFLAPDRGLLLPLVSSAATLEECKTAIKAVQNTKDSQFFQPHAGKGDPMAQFQLGIRYQFGFGVPHDYAEAARWYRKAAEQGNSCAQNGLGILYANGYGVPRNAAEAATWYRKAADQGHSMAQYNLGVLYREGYGVPKDNVEAAKWFRKAAEQGNDAARGALERLGR